MKTRFKIRKTSDRFRVEAYKRKTIIKSFSLSPKNVFFLEAKTKLNKEQFDQLLKEIY